MESPHHPTFAMPLSKSFADLYLADENEVSARLIAKAKFTPAEAAATEALARELAGRVRTESAKRGGVDALTQEYALSTEEGVALMCLAEACCGCRMPRLPTG